MSDAVNDCVADGRPGMQCLAPTQGKVCALHAGQHYLDGEKPQVGDKVWFAFTQATVTDIFPCSGIMERIPKGEHLAVGGDGWNIRAALTRKVRDGEDGQPWVS